ncbi:MAG: hypothetical protein U1E70_21355 [Acetobacteraceae bacterium]
MIGLNWTHTGASGVTASVASPVEFVQALTSVAVVGGTRSQRGDPPALRSLPEGLPATAIAAPAGGHRPHAASTARLAA